ncbi:MAG: hypothetical protein ABI693_03115 [Bryobacteraceae bacterium]
MSHSLRRSLGVAILLVALALFLRLAWISAESVDGDELFSLRVASADVPQALNLIKQDLVHPPLYYLALKLTLPDSRPVSPTRIRFLSLAAGATCIVIVILAGYIATPLRSPAILAALLLALNKTHIFYSQQARSYALFCLLVGMLLVWSCLMERHGYKWMYWLTGTTVMVALFYTHYFGIFYSAAVVLPVVLTNNSKRLRMQAVASLALACALFLPWVYQILPVYQNKSGISSNLGWQGLPTLYDLKMTFADYLGIPDFTGATTLVLVAGTILIAIALLPAFRNEHQPLGSRTKFTLALMLVMPPVLAFILSRWPFNLPIFGERHVLPSILAALLLACYGLWRLSSLASKPSRVLAGGVTILFLLQVLPLWNDWPGPSRVPYAAIADTLGRTDRELPVYTTWPYGIGEPVAFYLQRSRPIDELPADPTTLPEKCIVLYRPAAPREDTAVHSLFHQFEITSQQYYSPHNSVWGTRLLVLHKRKAGGAL